MKIHCLESRITLHVTSFMRFLTTVYVRLIFSLKSAGANQTPYWGSINLQYKKTSDSVATFNYKNIYKLCNKKLKSSTN